MNYGEELPCALVVARQNELQRNQNILYNLVMPTKDNPNLIESNLKLANVLPKNRIYRMESVEEFDLFRAELLKRPLVLQCTVDGGPGMACMKWFPNLDCRIVRFSENYIVLLNQNHPKILGRLQMGLEVAQRAMQRSQPFILTFSFNDVIQRLFPAILQEFSETIGHQDVVNCNDGEIIIRYNQDSKAPFLTDAINVKDMTFKFEDLDSLDMKVDSLKCAQARQRRSLPLDQGELVSILKGWKFGDLDTTKDLLNAYAQISDGPSYAHAQISDGPSYAKASDSPSSYGHSYHPDASRLPSNPPPYENAIRLPATHQRPQELPRNYGYSYDSQNYRSSPPNARPDPRPDPRPNPQDRPVTFKRVIKPPDDMESDGFPRAVSTEYVNIGFSEEQERRQEAHRNAVGHFRSDNSHSNVVERQQGNVQGKADQHRDYDIPEMVQGFQKREMVQEMEEPDGTEIGLESFI